MTYEEAAEKLIAETGVTVRKWRDNGTGVAYTSAKDWGIEAPRPTTAKRFGVFAHEVGHQLLHRKDRGRRNSPRWVEEVEAWDYALTQFSRFGLDGQDSCLEWAVRSVSYAFGKALRRSKSGDLAAKIQGTYPGWWNLTKEYEDERRNVVRARRERGASDGGSGKRVLPAGAQART